MVDEFVSKHLRLIEKEREAEIEENRSLTEKLTSKELERRGVCLSKLVLAERKTGYYGRIIVTFEPYGFSKELPSHSFAPGDIAALQTLIDDSNKDIASGIVTKAGSSSVSVAFDEKNEISSLDEGVCYKLQKLANDVTYKRLKRALNDLSSLPPGPSSRLVGVLFGEQELSPPHQINDDINFVNAALDESQKKAVTFALAQHEVAVVHGPPGTGKTTTVVEIITQMATKGSKLLVCAPSNIAVDNLVERLAANKLKIVRLGHPARVLPHIQKYSLDAILSTSEETRLVEDVRRDLDDVWKRMRKSRDRGEQNSLKKERSMLRKELHEREEKATREILKRADVILSTLTSASNDGPLKSLEMDHFDMVVIDECSQAIEAACWIPLVRAPQCVLAGDHLQLPPTILSKEAAKGGLELTLMERILQMYQEKVMRMLTVQYRMHHLIMQWSSDQLYNSRLQAHPSVAEHLLRDLPSIDEGLEEADHAMVFVDTAGCHLYELDTPEEISKGNEGEAAIVLSHVDTLIKGGLLPEDIAVIAPYNLQVELLRLRIHPKYPKVEVKTVDGFQGREKEAVLITMVRSNAKGEVGFLSEKRRINVAITRARRHVFVVCDSDTVSHDDFLKSMVSYFEKHADIRTAQEYINNENLRVHFVFYKIPIGGLDFECNRPDHLEDLLSQKSKVDQKGSRPKTGASKKKKQLIAVQVTKHNQNEDKKRFSTEEEVNTRKEEFSQQLLCFAADSQKTVLEFPSQLNSYERMLVHEIAENMKLSHVSEGIDKDRHIVVRKPGTSVPFPNTEKTDGEAILTNNYSKGEKSKKIAVAEAEPDKLACPHCSKDVIKANYNLHELNCLRIQRLKSAAVATQNSKQTEEKTSRPKSSKKRLHQTAKDKIEKIDADDFDALIAAAQQVDEDCAFKKCKTKVKTLGQNCEYCNQRFCLSHHIPEVHGCGEVAKATVRATHIREGILYRSSMTTALPLDPNKKASLQRKLNKKITDMTEKRSHKKPQK